MPFLPGYRIIAKKNGTEIPAVSASFNKEPGEAGATWQIQFAHPIEVLATDTFSLSVGIGGSSWVRFEDALASTYGDSIDATPRYAQTVSGKLNKQYKLLNEYSLPLTYCFVNPNWAKSLFGAVHVDSQGQLVSAPVTLSAGIGTIQSSRLYHQRLPGKEKEAGTFQCVLSCLTHQDIATYFGQLLDIDIYVNTPKVDIRDTCTFESGTNLFECFKKNFMMWNPEIRVELIKGRIKISILDILSPQSAPVSNQVLNLSAKAISSISVPDLEFQRDLIDHVIIIGRAPLVTQLNVDQPNFTPVKIPEIATPINQVISSDISFEEIKQLKVLPEYSGTFGSGDDAFTVSHLNRQYTTVGYHAKSNNAGDVVRLPVMTIHNQIDTTGVTVGKTVIQNWYGEGDRIIRTQEKQYNYCPPPGSRANQLMLTMVKTTSQQYVVEAIGVALTAEIVEELVVYDATEAAGGAVKENPNPFAGYKRMDKSRLTIDKQTPTAQRLMGMTTHYRLTYISRTDDNTLEKKDFDYDVLSGMYQNNSQTLQNPKPVGNRTQKDKPFRKEYFRPGTLGLRVGKLYLRRPPLTITHDDICDEDLAIKLKTRAFFRKSVEWNKSLDVKCKVPVPVYDLGTKINLGDVAVRVDGSAQTISGGTYYLRGFREDMSSSDTGINYDQNLQIRVRF